MTTDKLSVGKAFLLITGGVPFLRERNAQTKNPADEIQTDSPAGLFVQLKAKSSKHKAYSLIYW